MKAAPASSWEQAYNNCLALPNTRDTRLLAVESIDEYEFIERELIGLKSGSDSVSVYIGLRKMNSRDYTSLVKDDRLMGSLCRYVALVEWCAVEGDASLSLLGG
jgi:hypothetical protein